MAFNVFEVDGFINLIPSEQVRKKGGIIEYANMIYKLKAKNKDVFDNEKDALFCAKKSNGLCFIVEFEDI